MSGSLWPPNVLAIPRTRGMREILIDAVGDIKVQSQGGDRVPRRSARSGRGRQRWCTTFAAWRHDHHSYQAMCANWVRSPAETSSNEKRLAGFPGFLPKTGGVGFRY
jgi:hypothetical protein